MLSICQLTYSRFDAHVLKSFYYFYLPRCLCGIRKYRQRNSQTINKVSTKSCFFIFADLAGFLYFIFLCFMNWKKPRNDTTNRKSGETGGKDICGK